LSGSRQLFTGGSGLMVAYCARLHRPMISLL
jgi:hypothetical protein